jgi:hypothetical protein
MMQTWLLKIGVILLKKPKFRKWAELEDKKYDAIKAVEQAAPTLPEKFYAYLSTALFLKIDFDTVYWMDVVSAFTKIHSVTVPDVSFPLVSRHSEKKDKKDAWDYSGRLWYFYSNIIATAYGWTIEQIAKLSVSEALAYIQEILTEKQLEHEFVWSTSEIAYPYNKQTKKSKFSPLNRPYWMLPDFDKKPEKITVRIRKSMLPVGNIEKIDVEAQKIVPK